jgi:hypothetical protein
VDDDLVHCRSRTTPPMHRRYTLLHAGYYMLGVTRSCGKHIWCI